MTDPQPPAVSSSPPVGEEELGIQQQARLKREILDAISSNDEDQRSLEKQIGNLIGEYFMEAASRLAQAEEQRNQARRNYAAAQAREQRLLAAFEGLIKDLQTAAGRCRDENWLADRFGYENAVEWAQAALVEAKGGKGC